MIRADEKLKLYNTYLPLFNSISNNSQLKGAKPFLRVTRRSALKDYKKGLKKINKNIKVFVEMPKIKSVGNGMVEEVYPKTKKENKNKVIEVHSVEVKKLSSPKKEK